MLNLLAKLWNSESLSPHGICLLWRPELIWTHAISDALIGLAYLSISVFLGYLLSKRRDIKFGWVVWCFAIFILACGGTHFLSILTLWSPDYGLEALVKIVTAIASVATAILLWPMLGSAIAWPSPEQLATANEALRASLKERDQALEQLRLESAERLRVEAMLHRSQKMEALGQLTGGLAHDYNNILAIITMNLGRAAKLLEAGAVNEVGRSLDQAFTAADRASRITRRMLDFSRQSPIVTGKVEVAGTVRELEPLLRDALGPTRTLQLELCESLPPVALDRSQFENALLNLVLNARDATPNGGTVTIRVAQLDSEKQPMVAVDVADTGQGMPPDVAEKAFDPFFTTKPVGKGSGLGLSQVFGFINHLGGKVEIDSVLDRGTTVSMAIPVRA